MYDHGSFSSEPKLLSKISRRPKHVATSIECVKKFMVELTCRHRNDVLRQYCSECRRICCGCFRPTIKYFV